MEAQIFNTQDAAEKSKSEKTVDGFHNFAARLGVMPRGGTEDNLLSKGHYEFNLVTRNRVQLEAGYRGSWIVGQVVDTFAEDMTRAGIILNTNEGAEDVTKIQAKMSKLQVWQSICESIKWGRLYGGAIGVLLIEGQEPQTPLDMENIGLDSFKGIIVYDRWQLNPSVSDLIQSGPHMGLPKFYDVVLGNNINDPGQNPDGRENDNATGQVRIHHSRCFRMIGIKLPFFQAITEMMWGESVLERMWDRLIEFDTATASTGSLVTRANLRTVSIDNLREILAAGGKAEEALICQFEYMRRFQQNEGITLLDKNDTFASTAYSFAGLSDVLIQFSQQISGSANIPLIRLFGQSPAGLSATGDSDIRLYYDTINAKQESDMRNPMEVILKVLWLSVTGQTAPSDLTFEFTPLWQMSAMDKATIAKLNTDTILEAHQQGAIDNATMMKELKQSSGENGLFTHITDEQIEEAANDEPPLPDMPDEPIKIASPDLKDKPPQDLPTQKVGDSAVGKLKRWFYGKKREL